MFKDKKGGKEGAESDEKEKSFFCITCVYISLRRSNKRSYEINNKI